MIFFLHLIKAIATAFTVWHGKKAHRFLEYEGFTLRDFLDWRMKMRILPETHSTTDAKGGENSFFFAACDAAHMACFDELPRKKKKSPCFAPVQNGLYISWSIF